MRPPAPPRPRYPSFPVPARRAPGGFSAWRRRQHSKPLCELLIPTDEFPGAGWAGAVRYIDLQLYGHFRELRGTYRDGLVQLEEVSQAAHRQAFTALTAEQQTALLTAIEAGKAPGWPADDQRRFFRMVLTHTMQSYYGDPRHGGNRDEVGYRSVGLSTTPTRGRSQHDIYQITKPGAK